VTKEELRRKMMLTNITLMESKNLWREWNRLSVAERNAYLEELQAVAYPEYTTICIFLKVKKNERV